MITSRLVPTASVTREAEAEDEHRDDHEAAADAEQPGQPADREAEQRSPASADSRLTPSRQGWKLDSARARSPTIASGADDHHRGEGEQQHVRVELAARAASPAKELTAAASAEGEAGAPADLAAAQVGGEADHRGGDHHDQRPRPGRRGRSGCRGRPAPAPRSASRRRRPSRAGSRSRSRPAPVAPRRSSPDRPR